MAPGKARGSQVGGRKNSLGCGSPFSRAAEKKNRAFPNLTAVASIGWLLVRVRYISATETSPENTSPTRQILEIIPGFFVGPPRLRPVHLEPAVRVRRISTVSNPLPAETGSDDHTGRLPAWSGPRDKKRRKERKEEKEREREVLTKPRAS